MHKKKNKLQDNTHTLIWINPREEQLEPKL